MAYILRSPQVNLSAVLAQERPSVDLRLHTYENSTRNFLNALTDYKNRAVTAISEHRNKQTTEKKKILERTHAVETETNRHKLKEVDLIAQLERENEERKDTELSVAALKRQLGTLRDEITLLDVDIQHYRGLTQNLQREKNKERSTLSSFASHVSPQSQGCEKFLACTIEGVEKDRLLTRFSHLDPSDPEREATFVLDISTEVYKVITSSPQLPSMHILVHTLNESHDIYAFFRDARAAFKLMLDPSAT